VATASTAAILIRLAQVEAHSLVIAAWRLALATLILTPITLSTHRSLAYTSVAASVVLVSTYPIFVGLASHLLLRERLSRKMVVALLVATAGSALIGLGDLGDSPHRLWGDVLALVGGISGAGYFLIGRRLRARLSLLAYIFPVYGTAAVGLMAVMLASGLPRVPQQPQTFRR
jgi:drug/metabolite transporter (DMT)-like permease